jgi:hypothetical protein
VQKILVLYQYTQTTVALKGGKNWLRTRSLMTADSSHESNSLNDKVVPLHAEKYMWQWRNSPTNSWPGLKTETSCQPHAPNALLAGIDPPGTHWIIWWVGFRRVWTLWRRDKLLRLSGNLIAIS